MMNKKNILLLIIAIIAVAGAIFALRWSKQVDQQLQNPEIFGLETSTGETSAQYLSSDFESLFSGEDMSELYNGQTGNFTSTGTFDE